MKRIFLLRIVPFLAVLALPAAAGAQARAPGVDITVRIRASEGGAPLPGAQVEMMGTGKVLGADSAGVVVLRGVEPGAALFEIRKMGFAAEHFTLNIPRTDTIGIDVDLVTEPVKLAELQAVSKWGNAVLRDAGFYQRRQSGIGSYVTREELEGRGILEFSDILRRMRGIRVVRTGDGRTVLVPTRRAASINFSCSVDVYVNGTPANAEMAGGDVNSRISVSEVEAVETYAGPAEIPIQWNPTGRACAVVVVWTRT